MTDRLVYGDPAMILKNLHRLSSLMRHLLLWVRPRTRIHRRSAWQSEFLFLNCSPGQRTTGRSPMRQEPFETATQKSKIPAR